MLRKLLDIGLMHIKKILEEMARTDLDMMDDVIGKGDIQDIPSKMLLLREEIRDIATELIVRYQPVARDLRYIQASLDVSYDLFRISRYIFEIRRTLELSGVDVEELEITNAISLVKETVAIAVTSFLDENDELVTRVFDLDSKIDEEYKLAISSLRQEITLKKAVRALIMRHLERISDHATLIARATVYVVRGERL
ncbi:putative protein Phosphate transport system regulator [Pyrococcus sp. NA2]|uniref:phosphate signaling complex PhoU family protein n=1 Tax=Pyrococcus sp. (strain NA2) TaxID=342949 RepID=UPI000209AFB5|nr:phosphate uptake regulator PhoU [Pyrococcus sp. NA2]AEC51150.1 putative protein Phosphate transport system regulator [Pyrococcus sp. NA2]